MWYRVDKNEFVSVDDHFTIYFINENVLYYSFVNDCSSILKIKDGHQSNFNIDDLYTHFKSQKVQFDVEN